MAAADADEFDLDLGIGPDAVALDATTLGGDFSLAETATISDNLAFDIEAGDEQKEASFKNGNVTDDLSAYPPENNIQDHPIQVSHGTLAEFDIDDELDFDLEYDQGAQSIDTGKTTVAEPLLGNDFASTSAGHPDQVVSADQESEIGYESDDFDSGVQVTASQELQALSVQQGEDEVDDNDSQTISNHKDQASSDNSEVGNYQAGDRDGGPMARGATTTVPVPFRCIKATWSGNRYWLFGGSGENPNNYFLSDLSALDCPLSEFLDRLRTVISNEINPSHDLHIRIEPIDLKFNRSSTSQLMSRTFRDIVECFEDLRRNDPTVWDEMTIHIFTVMDGEARFRDLLQAARSGNGLNELPYPHWRIGQDDGYEPENAEHSESEVAERDNPEEGDDLHPDEYHDREDRDHLERDYTEQFDAGHEENLKHDDLDHAEESDYLVDIGSSEDERDSGLDREHDVQSGHGVDSHSAVLADEEVESGDLDHEQLDLDEQDFDLDPGHQTNSSVELPGERSTEDLLDEILQDAEMNRIKAQQETYDDDLGEEDQEAWKGIQAMMDANRLIANRLSNPTDNDPDHAAGKDATHDNIDNSESFQETHETNEASKAQQLVNNPPTLSSAPKRELDEIEMPTEESDNKRRRT